MELEEDNGHTTEQLSFEKHIHHNNAKLGKKNNFGYIVYLTLKIID